LDLSITGEQDSALWTNVFKMNVKGSVMQNCRARDVSALERSQRGLLQQEIAILKPDAVVFFSGPSYDSTLQREFLDLNLSSVSRQIPIGSLAAVRSAHLPVRTIRTFHPEYLQRSRQLGLLKVISRWIKG
jgi:hypothetical protein